MGDRLSKEEKQEKKMIRSPNIGEASDLYWASRAGDVDAVRNILATTRFKDLNRLEPNGSTALHAASFFGHADVVRLLLERGVIRYRKNRHGLTAYEEAANDEIRQLFHRPNSNRFCSDFSRDNEDIFHFINDSPPEEGDDKAYDKWVKTSDNEVQVKAAKSIISVMKILASSPRLRQIVELMAPSPAGVPSEDADLGPLQKLIDTSITSTHPEYEEACDLVSKYKETKNPGHLLRLYSLETPFYHDLGSTDNRDHLLGLLMYGLSTLKGRSFRGRTYRGLSMTRKDFIVYELALKKKGSIIWTRTFCSTSVDEAIARRFIPTSFSENRSVLMVFDFPKPCDMAIQLYALSDKLPCISNFEDEREVLVLPMTMFHVVNITNENCSNQYTIHLENVLPKFDLMALISAGRKDDLPDV